MNDNKRVLSIIKLADHAHGSLMLDFRFLSFLGHKITQTFVVGLSVLAGHEDFWMK
ncbi:MAG: hypothetical protein ACK6EB_14960 [Planctomyces sp.]